MNLEPTNAGRGYLGYDAECGFCARFVDVARPVLLKRHIHPVPLQSDWACHAFGLNGDGVPDEMKLLTAGGKVFGGADAIKELMRLYWWAWPGFLLTQLPGCRHLLARGYKCIAHNRNRLGCEKPSSGRPARAGRHRLSGFYDMP